jgi:hypothetical protein
MWSRLPRVYFLLLKLRYSATESYLIMVYHALFHCHITYGLLLWGHSCRVPDVLRMQKRALRIITSSDFRASCRPLFARINIFTVVGHFIFLCILHVKRRSFWSEGMFKTTTRDSVGSLTFPEYA